RGAVLLRGGQASVQREHLHLVTDQPAQARDHLVHLPGTGHEHERIAALRALGPGRGAGQVVEVLARHAAHVESRCGEGAWSMLSGCRALGTSTIPAPSSTSATAAASSVADIAPTSRSSRS